MPWFAGIDGCRGGWIVVLIEQKAGEGHNHLVTLCPTFADILTFTPQPTVIAIDIPIGLLDTPQPGGRECDRQARKLLGRRASSVFSPPIRSMLQATSYEQVRAQGLSVQAFGILPKIHEVDQLMTPELQMRIHEAHPELAFMALAGAPLQSNKKTREGREERLRVLSHWGFPGSENGTSGSVILRSVQHDTPPLQNVLQSICSFRRSQVAPDDLLDAYVLAWTALRISSGQATRIPAKPPTDKKGLRMEIWN